VKTSINGVEFLGPVEGRYQNTVIAPFKLDAFVRILIEHLAPPSFVTVSSSCSFVSEGDHQ
jgi:hypothetical protein